MELKHFLQLMRERMWFISVMVIVFTASIGFYSYYYMEPQYEATAKVILIRANEEAANRAVDLNMLTANGMLIDTYRNIAKTPRIMQKTAEDNPQLNMTASELMNAVKVTSNDSQILSVVVTDPSYNKAADIVNAVSAVIIEEIPKIMEINNVSLLDQAPALTDPSPVEPNYIVNMTIAFIVSFMLSIAIILIRKYLNNKIRSVADIEQALEIPTLIVFPKMKKGQILPMLRTTTTIVKEGEKSYVAINQ